ncbi:hypothetical protein CK203_023474 [Vitis vinifera]|uniref:Uncharacterized protein n=1 Tax=Vitis vinifera TaxID=29760 RepID=A0A438J6K9_VITVI|nr:hypothetical protein CK203_023474 [Vitis vinifera]
MANPENVLSIQAFHQCSSLVSIKLNMSNLLLWRSQVLPLVRSLGLIHHLSENRHASRRQWVLKQRRPMISQSRHGLTMMVYLPPGFLDS